MTLQTNATLRIGTQLLIELTNQNTIGAVAVDAAVLDAAVADTQAELLIETGLTYDDTDPAHVAASVQGVLWYLHSYTGITKKNVEDIGRRWRRMLIALAATRGGERRLLPDTNSVLQPSTERTNKRPDHDRSRWDGFVPNTPGANDGSDDDGVL